MAIDSTDKVRARDLTEQRLRVEQDAVRFTKSSEAQTTSKPGTAAAKFLGRDISQTIDTVTLDSARAIQQGIDPLQLSVERTAKLQKLKEQIENGEYKVDSRDLARSVAQELVQEIYFAPTEKDDTAV